MFSSEGGGGETEALMEKFFCKERDPMTNKLVKIGIIGYLSFAS